MIILGPVAVSENGVIGKNNDLPWNFPEDLKRFKKITFGKTVLMGRKTFESIFARLKKPLSGRKNVVITRQPGYKAPDGVLVFHSFEEAVSALSGEDVYVIGGAEIFKLAIPLAGQFYLTRINGEYEGDAYFPPINWGEWKEESQEKFPSHTFLKFVRGK